MRGFIRQTGPRPKVTGSLHAADKEDDGGCRIGDVTGSAGGDAGEFRTVPAE